MTLIDSKSDYEGARFKRGHIIKAEDLPILRSMGKYSITMLHLEEGDVHKDDAAHRLGKHLAGEGIFLKGPEEGKINLCSNWNGLIVYDEEAIYTINEDLDLIVATVPNKVPVGKNEPVAGVRCLPLTVKEEQITRAGSIALPITVFPFHPLKTALITTGREIVEGRIRDAFAPKLVRKLAFYGSTLMEQMIIGDEEEEIVSAIQAFLNKKAELIIVTGGMSVDADDRTTAAIVRASESVIFKGVPALPGARLMLALHGKTKIVGAPACVVRDEWTSMDPVLNRLFAGLIPTLAEVRRWGVGGFCRRCRVCNYPMCAFASR
ncbi:MAG: molybdopterin-binding protein [Synergistota bacterium]|nr:molybdopterin-binding protein [Synergistota bacterium]